MKLLLFVLVLVYTTAFPARAQADRDLETVAFVTTLGNDTLAVEQVRRTPERVEATVVLRSPRTTVTQYRLDLDGAGGFSRYEATTRLPGAPSEAMPLRQETVVPQGDSLRMSVTEGEDTRVRTIAGDAQALPFIDMVHWPFDLMLERARASGQDSVAQPLFTERGVMLFTIGKGADAHSTTVTHPFRGTMQVEADAEGRLLALDAGATTRKLAVTRVEAVDVDALVRRFAARDAAGTPFGPLSGRGEVTAQTGGATITVDYGQPARRGRELFGALVPWGELWRTGANRATHFETTRDLLVGNLRVPAGEYTLFTIPEPEGGVLIFNRQTGQGGTTYDEAQDLGRVPMSVSALPEPVELFTIAVEEGATGGAIELRWGRTAFSVPFTIAE